MGISFSFPFIKTIAGVAEAQFTRLLNKNRYCTIFGGPVSGKKVLFSREMETGTLTGRNEMKSLKAIQKLISHQVALKKDSVILDAGAGFGLYELFFAKQLGDQCQVYSFESGAGAQELLQKNLEANNIKNVTVIRKAISGKIGIINFYENPLFGSSLVEEAARSKETVEKTVFTTTIDIFCKRYELSPAFIRLNVNGGAGQALSGAMETIGRSRPLIFTTPRLAEERTAIAQLMQQQRYEAFSLTGFEWLRVKDEDGSMEDLIHGPVLLCPCHLREEVNYAMYNRYRRDAAAIQKWAPNNNTSGGYAFN